MWVLAVLVVLRAGIRGLMVVIHLHLAWLR